MARGDRGAHDRTMPDLRSLIADVDVAVVDPDLLWRVSHMNLLRGVVVRDFAAPEEALDTLTGGRPAIIVMGPDADVTQLALAVEAREARPELRILHCVHVTPPAGDADEPTPGSAPGSTLGPDASSEDLAEAGVPAEGATDEVVPTTPETTPETSAGLEGFDATIPYDGDEEAFVIRVRSMLVAARVVEGLPPEPIGDEASDGDDSAEAVAGDGDATQRAADERDASDGDVIDVDVAWATPGGPEGDERRSAGAAPAASHHLHPGPRLELPARLAIITSAKGGEGSSTVALNLAHELATRAGVRTAIVDGEPFFGDVTMDLGAIATRAPVVDDLPLGEEVLEQLVTFPAGQGPIVVRSPVTRDGAAARAPDVLRTLLSVAGQIADVVVADVPFELLVESPWLDQVAVVVLVSTGRTTSLKNALVAAERLTGSATVGLVVNEIEHSQRKASPEEMARTVGLPLLGHLPSTGALRRAATKPRPREIAAPHTRYAHAVTDMRRTIASHFPVLV